MIGFLGISFKKQAMNGDFYIVLWNPKSRKITNGDYDIIEIHESSKIKDYDAIISKIIDFLYNEIKRFKPINEVVVRIIGNPQISESTKRRLEEHFLKVEYLVPKLEKI